MIKPKHTPGPWTVELAEGVRVLDANGRRVASVSLLSWKLAEPRSEAEICMNAQLIAAAPDLYEALEAIQKARFHPDPGEMSEANNMAAAALAKARGESAP